VDNRIAVCQHTGWSRKSGFASVKNPVSEAGNSGGRGPRLASELGLIQQALIAEGIKHGPAIPVRCSSIIIVVTLAPLRDLIVGSAARHDDRGRFGRRASDDS
jgi:hypothetical protein